MWNMVRWPRTWGYQPVMKEQRLGVQTGFWQKAWRKETASVCDDLVEVGRDGGRVAEVAHDIAAPLVGVEDDDVGLFGHGRSPWARGPFRPPPSLQSASRADA